MDVETALALERIIERVDALDTSLGVAFRDDLRHEISALRDETRQDSSALRESVAEVRPHAVILEESTREDVRFVAEAVADLSVTINSLQR